MICIEIIKKNKLLVWEEYWNTLIEAFKDHIEQVKECYTNMIISSI